MRVFYEKQRFDQWWIQLINFSILGILGYFLYRWFFLKEAVDKVAADDSYGQLIVIVVLLLSFGLIYLFQLKTRIDEKGIHYRFIPFHFSEKTIYWRDMAHCHTRKYSPIREYGGWGLRISSKHGMAYNIKGNQGIQIALKTGKKLLIGTQRPVEAQDVIQRYFKTS